MAGNTFFLFVEPTVTQVISKRVVEKQQMRWAPMSAHPPTAAGPYQDLNDEFAEVFQLWHSAFVARVESAMMQELAA